LTHESNQEGNVKHEHQALVLTIVGVFCAFSFAFITNEAIHETGHWIAHVAYGAHVGVILDPFGGSRIVGGAASSAPAGVTSLAGPLFSVLFSAALFVTLWHWRGPRSAPFLFMFPIALIQEGVTFSLGLMTPGGDASYVAAWGVPVPLLAAVLPLAGLSEDARWGRVLIVAGTSMVMLMLLRFAVSVALRLGSLTEAVVPLVFSVLLALAIAASFGIVHRVLSRQLRGSFFPVRRSGVTVSLMLAVATVVLQLTILN
jgi:hypothetical protein